MDEPTGDQAGQEVAHRRAQELRAEAEAVAADPDDRAEAAAILKDMESLRVW